MKNVLKMIPMVATLSLCSCGYFIDQPNGLFRDRANDYQHSQPAQPIKVPNGMATNRIQPALPIPGESHGVTMENNLAVTEGSLPQQAILPVEQQIKTTPDGDDWLSLDANFFRAWAIVGLSLEKANIPIDYKDEEKGVYTIRPQSIERKEPPGGLLSRLIFWRKKSTIEPKRYHLHIYELGEEKSAVRLLDDKGNPAPTDVNSRLMGVISKTFS